MTHHRRQEKSFDPVAVATALERENETANEGRGSSVIRTVIGYLRHGKVTEAKSVWNVDSDKVRQYDRLYALAARLFGTER